MSASSIYRAAHDEQLIARVTALAYEAMINDAALADTNFGRTLSAPSPVVMPGYNPAAPLMFPVAVDTQQAYESALLNMRGAPGYDIDIITDAQITESILAHWPQDPGAPTVTPQ